MQLSEIIKIVDGKLQNGGKLKKKIANIKFDSRKVKKNDLYVCIIGKKNDGHDYIKEAIKNGALAVIVSRDVDCSIPTIKVDNTLNALENLACHKRKQFKGHVIAITGSVGKTTTKEMLATILKQKYNVLYSEGNKNNVFGLTETIFNLKKENEILLVELGMNHKGEIENLTRICKPNISVITNIGSSHIGNLKNKKNILKAKMEIISGMKNGQLYINGDDLLLRKIKRIKDNDLIKCGVHNGNIKCRDFEILSDKSLFSIDIKERTENFSIPLPGKHFINNTVIAIAISLFMNISVETIQIALNEYKTCEQRYKIYQNNNITLIDDSYNSSYESLKANLSTLNDSPKKLLIIGDVLELGKKTKKIHKKIGKLLSKSNGNVIVVGENMKILSKKYCHFLDCKGVIKYLDNIDLDNYQILIKGSHAIKLEMVSNYLKKRFDLK